MATWFVKIRTSHRHVLFVEISETTLGPRPVSASPPSTASRRSHEACKTVCTYPIQGTRPRKFSKRHVNTPAPAVRVIRSKI